MGGLLGKKIRMTQVFDDNGKVQPVTVIAAGPCFVTQVKTKESDGYEAVQVGFGELKEKHLKKPQAGHFKKAGVSPQKFVREFNTSGQELKVGDELNVGMFTAGEEINLVGTSKGRGFQGVMKRHGFGGANITHGQSDRQRAPGSLGQSSDPSRVFKGLRMAGRMGNDRITVTSARIVKIDAEKNLLFVSGSVPGTKDSLVEIKKK